MKITSHKSKIRSLKNDNPHFFINDGFVVSPRAGFEINKKCPAEYRLIISECINRGWLKPVAHISEKEMIFIGLGTC